MRKGRRSAERLSYWPELGSRALTRREQEMPRSLADKCFPMVAKVVISLALVLLIALTLSTKSQAQGPALTTISDTVYRADGTAASGTVLISWPSFQTAEGDAVAAGNLNVTIGPLGAFTAQLVPNVGASPAETYYIVVFQLDDGTVRTEYWAVPATSPTTIAAVLTTPGTGPGNLTATQPYVNAAVANRAIDATVVHLAGTETITGTKQFTVPPSLPAPVGASDAANKGYVDAAVGNVGGGAYVPVAGGTMTGPLTLPADPAAPNQAADRNYVDSGLAVKADLVNGTVPPGELGAGIASAATCLTGNSTWGSCGGGGGTPGGSNTQLQINNGGAFGGLANVGAGSPLTSQGTSSAPAFALGLTLVTPAMNWSQTSTTALTANMPGTVVLTPCPSGVDYTSGAGYQVYISDANAEAVSVTSGSTGSGNCSITFTPFFNHSSYTIKSASSGIQETINTACGVQTAGSSWNGQCNVTVPGAGGYTGSAFVGAGYYPVYGTIFFHANQSALNGPGAVLQCYGRAACIQVGDQASSTHYVANTVSGFSFRTDNSAYNSNSAYVGVNITNVAQTTGYRTITTATAHNFRPGDMVTIMFTDTSAFWGDAVVYDCGSGSSAAACTSSSTTFRIAGGTGSSSEATPGVVALAYSAVLDNSNGTHLSDLNYDFAGAATHFNNFFDMWDDENATIDHFSNNGIPLNANANWTGSFVFSGGQSNIGHNLAPVITIRDANITANYSNCVTDYNSNGLYIYDTVCQASGPWQVYSSNITGNYQGANIRNIYSESNLGQNPASPAHSPWPGLGIGGLIAGVSTSAANFKVEGNGAVSGYTPTGGTGSTYYGYYIVANDTTAGTHTSPMYVLSWESTGSDSIPVKWPRIANGADVITYDVIRSSTVPYIYGCPGGSGGTCGSVATAISQATACAGGLVCTYTDTGSSTTSSYSINLGSYAGPLSFWPGSIVTVNHSVTVDNEVGAIGVGLGGNPIQIAALCAVNGGAASPGGFTSCFASLTDPTGDVVSQPATILTDGAPQIRHSPIAKGRLNFSTADNVLYPRHIITLIDSQPTLTKATQTYRPLASIYDTYIGTDVVATNAPLVTQGQLAFGAPVSISNYIANTGDNVSWLERLSASQKEFNVPVKFDQSVTLSGLSNGCLNVVSGVIASTGSACGSGSGGGNVNSVFGRSGAVAAAGGDYTVSQVTGAAADAAVVHNTGAETIAGAKTFTSTVTMSGGLLLPRGNAYVPAIGGIGLDTAAGLPVVNIAGTTQQVALTSSNISGQAGTALALAATPTQCSGSFATGIAANGNANCAVADVIQLHETAAPAGIPNWGEFWFDSTYHAPFFIDNAGQAVQLGLTNLFNSDPGGDSPDNLEERNGSNPQNLRVYSSYTNNTTWTRMSLGYDSASGYQVLRSEDATSGNALGLGMYIGSSVKWEFGATGMLKPNTDNSYDMGTDSGQAMRSVFAKTSFNMYSSGRQDFEFLNDATNGTTLNQLAVYNSSATGVQTAATTSTDGVVGIVSSGAGTTNRAVITWAGVAACNFDAANPTAGDYVVASTTAAGKCHDTGSTTRPTAVQVIGRIESGEVRVSLGSPSGSGGGGAVSSVFGRSGTVTAASGDYSVAQVTGAAVDSTVVHLAGTETISGSKTFSSDVTLSGNLNVAGNINQTGTGPTQWSGQEWTGTTVTVPSGMAFSLGVGSDGGFRCQLASGTSCMLASDLTTGTLPHAQLPALVSGDIPNNAANTTGTAANLSGTPTLPSGTAGTTQSAGDNSTKLATTAYVRSEIQMAWSCPVVGTTAVVSYCNWTLPAAITITGFDLAASTAATGCTTYPTLQVWDGTANAEVGSYSIAFTSGTNFFTQVTGSTNVASGHLLRLKIATAGAGCSTNAAGVVGTLTYQMQN